MLPYTGSFTLTHTHTYTELNIKQPSVHISASFQNFHNAHAHLRDAHILVSHLMRGHQKGWVCAVVRTHKLLKNVVYSFHWCEFKLSSIGLRL